MRKLDPSKFFADEGEGGSYEPSLDPPLPEALNTGQLHGPFFGLCPLNKCDAGRVLAKATKEGSPFYSQIFLDVVKKMPKML